MDLILLILAAVLLILGVVGSILPVLPGAPLSWAGLLTFYFTSVPFNYWVLSITFILALAIMILQYIIPAYGTKKYGGSKWGMVGTIIGLFAGFFIPVPGGIFIGAFIGAFAGELFNKSDSRTAVRAAYGSFIGFIASSFMELIITVSYFGIFIFEIFRFREILF